MKYKSFILLLILLFTITTETWAQRKKRVPLTKETADSLIESYQFNEAIKLIRLEIEFEKKNSSRKKKKNKAYQDWLQTKLQEADKLLSVQQATEKVTFLDSMVVSKTELLNEIHLSKESGKLDCLENLVKGLKVPTHALTRGAYLNELADRVIFPLDIDSATSVLHHCERYSDTWTSPTPFSGLKGQTQAYPYFMSDGTTFYYAAIDSTGLGGYDLYVTHYDTEKNDFLKSENLGMPFNSPANDYLYAIDETRGIGWFATDRRQHPDSVCIYTFLPSESRETYNPLLVGEEMLRKLSMLHSIDNNRADNRTLKLTGERLKKLSKNERKNTDKRTRYIITNERVYTHLAEFKSPAAQSLAQQWIEMNEKIEQDKNKLIELRNLWAKTKDAQTPELRSEIEALEQALSANKKSLTELAKSMRNAELEYE